MRNYFSKVLLASITFIFTTVAVVAQPRSEAFAGGEITMEFAGNPALACDGPQPYNFTLKFYRDCTPQQLELTKTIYLWSPSNNNTLIEVNLAQRTPQGQIDNLCLQGDPVCTVGQWYTTNNPVNVPFPAKDWRIGYGTVPFGNIANGFVGRDFQSPASLNIEAGQTFFVLTRLNNLDFCGEVNGVFQNNLNDTIRRINAAYNTSARWITPHPVETFCIGQSYNYKLPVVDDDEFIIDGDLTNNSTTDTIVIRDSLSYEITTALSRYGFGVRYLTNEGYTATSPFPSSTPITFDKKEGILSFTPSAAGGGGFIAVVAFNVLEWRKYFVVDSVCLKPGGGCTSIERTPIIRTRRRVINTTTRQMRFVFDTRCNKRLPDFTSTEFNPSENAWEFECASTELDFTMTQPMLLKTALDDPKWLSMYRGKPGQPRDDNAIGIDSIVPLNSTPLQEFTQFRVYLYEPIGPGNYTLFPKPNKQLTGIKNRCGFELEEGSVLIPIYINTDYTYRFADRDGLKEFCYPADLPFEVDALQGQDKLRSVASLYTWRFVEFDPNTPKDSIYPPKSTYNIPVDTNILGNLEFPEGTWEVGVGLDFGYTYNDTAFEAFCYDEDNFEVIFYQNDPVEIPDYDLCADEPWPTINLDTMTTLHNAINYRWTYYNRPLDQWDLVGGNSNSGKKNSSFNVASIGSGLGKPYIITSEVELEQGKCFERDTFIVLKDIVRVDLDFGRDSTICPGFEYRLTNSTSYLVPDSMSYQWYINDEPISNGTTNSIQISDGGMYRLEVTKNTENSFCMGEDSVFITIADSLGPPEPICSEVTFKDGDIEQTFYIPALQGAEDFQVRQVDPLGNEGEWVKTNSGALDHIIRGRQLRLQARGVNTEVEEDAPCRYGPIGFAEACNAVVKPVNVFTPNGDGVNEFLRFDLLEVFPGSPLQIYNRWGELIYDTNNYLNDWDGENYEDGTYFYVLDINDESQGVLKGTFTILR